MILMVDVSGSKLFGTQNQFKDEIVTEIAATLAFSALQNNDKIGVVLFSDQTELYIPPKKGKSHVLRIIRELIEFQPKSKKTNIASAFQFLSSVMKKKAIVFMLSDFIANDYSQTLKIVGRKHDVTGIRVFDKHEETMPNLGLVTFKDAESGTSKTINTGSKKVRDNYANFHHENAKYFEESFKKSGCGIINSRVDEDYVKKTTWIF